MLDGSYDISTSGKDVYIFQISYINKMFSYNQIQVQKLYITQAQKYNNTLRNGIYIKEIIIFESSQLKVRLFMESVLVVK